MESVGPSEGAGDDDNASESKEHDVSDEDSDKGQDQGNDENLSEQGDSQSDGAEDPDIEQKPDPNQQNPE